MRQVTQLTAAWPIALMMAALFAGCGVGVYQVSRAALVSPPSPPQWAGNQVPIGFSAGNSTVLWKTSPKNDPSSPSGLYVAGTQIDTDFHIGLGSHVALWFPVEYGFEQASFSAVPCQIGRPSHGVWTAGIGVAGTGMVSTHWYLGGSLETMLSFVPSNIHAVCVAGSCNLGSSYDDQDTTAVPVIRATFLAGVDFGIVRIFGGLSLRNHPTNVRLEYQLVYDADDVHGNVGFGMMYLVPGVGAEVDIGDHFSIQAQVYQPVALGQPDLIYGPIAGITLDVHASRHLEPVQPEATPPEPPAPPPAESKPPEAIQPDPARFENWGEGEPPNPA